MDRKPKAWIAFQQGAALVILIIVIYRVWPRFTAASSSYARQLA